MKKSKVTENRIFAERSLDLIKPGGERVAFTVLFGLPYPAGEDFRCPVRFKGWGNPPPDVWGIDSVHALLLAISLVHSLLAAFVERGGRIVYPGTDDDFNMADFRTQPVQERQTAEIGCVALFTRDLAKVQAFYSAIGIAWADGKPEEIGKTDLPLSVEKRPPPYGGAPGIKTAGLPDLFGSFGDTDFCFYLDTSLPQQASAPQTRIFIQLDDPEQAIERLKAANLYVPSPDAPFGGPELVIDPDGRHVQVVRCFG